MPITYWYTTTSLKRQQTKTPATWQIWCTLATNPPNLASVSRDVSEKADVETQPAGTSATNPVTSSNDVSDNTNACVRSCQWSDREWDPTCRHLALATNLVTHPPSHSTEQGGETEITPVQATSTGKLELCMSNSLPLSGATPPATPHQQPVIEKLQWCSCACLLWQ